MSMQRTISVYSLLLLLCTPSLNARQDFNSIKGVIEFPAHYNGPREFIAHYQGKIDRCDHDGFFTFPLEKPRFVSKKKPPLTFSPTTTPSLLICEKNTMLFERKNTAHTQAHHARAPYRYFEEDEMGDWQEKKLPSHGKTPANCVVVAMNPEIVASVRAWEVELLHPTTIKMPKIILKQNVPMNIMTEASAYSQISGLDSGPVHEQVKKLESKNKQSSQTLRHSVR